MKMTQKELNVILAAHKEWALDSTKGKRADLRKANLRAANFSGANLREADLSGADLSGAYLGRANLRSANLSGANFSGANLSRTCLRGANFSEANLSGADLVGADLLGANFRWADLRWADLLILQAAPYTAYIQKDSTLLIREKGTFRRSYTNLEWLALSEAAIAHMDYEMLGYWKAHSSTLFALMGSLA